MKTLFKSQCLLILSSCSALLFLFAPGLFFSQVPAFRDAYHFYYPQEVWLEKSVEHGELFPTWNHQEALGVSVPAQGSTGLYYPLRIIGSLRGLTTPQKFSLALLLHVVIAGLGAAYSARQCRCSVNMCWLAAISYSLACPVFFQLSNQIYLFGAAWNGFALGALIASSRPQTAKGYLKYACLFAIATSLMLLAGDPQSAANAWLIAFFAVAVRYAIVFFGKHGNAPKVRPFSSFLPISSAWLIGFVLFIAVTAIQWMPSSRLAALTVRSDQIWKHEGHVKPLRELNQLVDSIPDEPHRIYAFSLSPWHLFSVAIPFVGGHYQPENARWFSLISAEGRMWLPSIFFGFIPLMLSIGLAKSRPSTLQMKWLFGLALLCFLAALGSYSAVWLMRQTLAVFADDWTNQLPSDGVTSLYWLLTFVPGYESFRYPAKWTTWLVLACSVYAACNFDLASKKPGTVLTLSRWGRLVGLSVAGVWAATGLALLSIWFNVLGFADWAASLKSSDMWLGQFNARIALQQLFLSTSVVMLSLWGLVTVCQIRWSSRGQASEKGSLVVGHRLVWLTLLEMTLIACFWIDFAEEPTRENITVLPSSDSLQPFVWVDVNEANLAKDAAGRVQNTAMQAAYQRTFLLGKLSELTPGRNFAATQSLVPAGITRLRNWLSWKDDLSSEQRELDAVLRRLGVTHRAIRSDAPGELAWKTVENSSPFCELWAEDGESKLEPVDNSLDLHWANSGELQLSFEVRDVAAVLVVRQFNDGGWQAEDMDTGLSLEFASRSPALFLEVKLPSDTKRVRILRKRGW